MQRHGGETGSGTEDEGDSGGTVGGHGVRGAVKDGNCGSASSDQHYVVPRSPLASPDKPGRFVREVEPRDPRAVRTTHALGWALVELMQEREFDSITVQQILERAGVGRTSFYTHFRNKQDVFDSSFERLFDLLEPLLDRPGSAGRLFPVREFAAHLVDARSLLDAIRRDGRLEDMWRQCVGYMARIIEKRLPPAVAHVGARKLQARMLAATLGEAIRWSLERPGEMTPREVDERFHRFAHAALTAR